MLQRAMCELQVLPEYQTSRHYVNVLDTEDPYTSHVEEQHPLILRGELRYVADWNAIMFLCNPLYVHLRP